MNTSDAAYYDQIVRIQGWANQTLDEMLDVLSDSDAELLRTVSKRLQSSDWNTPRQMYLEIESIGKEVSRIRTAAMERMEQIVVANAEIVAQNMARMSFFAVAGEVLGLGAAEEAVQSLRGESGSLRSDWWENVQQNVLDDLAIRAELEALGSGGGKKPPSKTTAASPGDEEKRRVIHQLPRELSEKQVHDIITYEPFSGARIDQWMSNWQENDLKRVVSVVQDGVRNGLDKNDVVKRIRGTAENQYRDGILQTSRKDASTVARTVINGVANEAHRSFAESVDKQVPGVVGGYMFKATLDGRTSKICAAMHATFWPADQKDKVKWPPLHPNCRSQIRILSRYSDDVTMPAAKEDFMGLAREEYDAKQKQKGSEKRFKDLAESTQHKYYYDQIKKYTKAHGDPFEQFSADKGWAEYIKTRPEGFQQRWLGRERYKLWQSGLVTIQDLVDPDTGYLISVAKLRERSANR